MRVAVLPFSCAEGVPDALGRQFTTFASDTLRAIGGDVVQLNLMVQVPDQPGRSAFVNLGGAMMEKQQLEPVFKQVQAPLVVDGMIEKADNGFRMSIRFSTEATLDSPKIETETFAKEQIFDILRSMTVRIANEGRVPLPQGASPAGIGFGTDDADVLLKYLEGVDALTYIQQANGMVVQEFDPERQFNLLTEALEADPKFLGCYEAVLELARMCAQNRIGRFVTMEEALKKLTQIVTDDYRAWYVLAEIHTSVGEWAEASQYYEKAIEIEAYDPALYTRLGIAQLNQGMPINAERSFRKALEREGVDKPSLDYLCTVLIQTGRGHEVPGLWKERIDANPTEPSFHARYGYALIQQGRKDEGEKAFEYALSSLEDTLIVKRYYAPLLVEQGELDRAMDFYEDCLDVTPTDIPLMMEYAKTLEKAGRDFEIPPILRNILQAGPDANTRAQASAWLIELEQPKRVEAVSEAAKKVESGDFEGAIRELKPLKNWLSEYWRLWAVLANCYNHVGEFTDAEDAAGRLINLMPGYEQGYSELMRALSGQEKYDQAYRAMKWAAMNMPQSLPIHLNFGLAAKQAGHVDEARALAKQIREALGANDEFEPVLSEIEK
jgi:tetratricopeptide (TPR) repeat protein